MWVFGSLLACHPWDEAVVDGLRTLERSFRTDHAGLATLRIDLDEGETAFLVTTLVPDNARVRVDSLTDPDGTEAFNADVVLRTTEAKTSAVWLSTVNTFGWPIQRGDREPDGDRWNVDLLTTDSTGVPLAADCVSTVLIKTDDNFSRGTLQVVVVYTDGVDDEADWVLAVASAVDAWGALMAERGVDLDVSFAQWSGDPVGAPGFSDPLPWEELSAAQPLGSIKVVLAHVIAEFPAALGITGNIPAPLIPSGQSGVLVGLDYAAGIDGSFSELEIQLLAETLAHESAHATGVFHPVEVDWDLYDALPDTPTCVTEQSCEAEFSSNLMFPYPICTSAFSCIAQTDLTDDQVSMVQRFVATR